MSIIFWKSSKCLYVFVERLLYSSLMTCALRNSFFVDSIETSKLYLSLSPIRQDLTQDQWPEGRLKEGDLREGKIGHESKLEPCWSMQVIDPPRAMWTWWALLVLDPNLGPGTDACNIWDKATYGTKGSMLQFAQPKVAQPKLGAFWSRICHWYRYPIRNECQTAQPRPGKNIETSKFIH